jgi:hypothetical protein
MLDATREAPQNQAVNHVPILGPGPAAQVTVPAVRSGGTGRRIVAAAARSPMCQIWFHVSFRDLKSLGTGPTTGPR